MLLVKLGISAAIPDVPHHVAVQVALCTAVLMRMCFCNCLYVFCLRVFWNWLRDNFPAGQGRVQEAPTGKKGKKGAGGRICSFVSTSSPYKLGPIVYSPTRTYIIWDRLHGLPVRRLLSQRVLKLSAPKTRWECRFCVRLHSARTLCTTPDPPVRLSSKKIQSTYL